MDIEKIILSYREDGVEQARAHGGVERRGQVRVREHLLVRRHELRTNGWMNEWEFF